MSECVRAGQLKPQDVSNLVAKTFWQATAPQLSPVHSVRPEGTPYEVVLTVYLVWEVGGGGGGHFVAVGNFKVCKSTL